ERGLGVAVDHWIERDAAAGGGLGEKLALLSLLRAGHSAAADGEIDLVGFEHGVKSDRPILAQRRRRKIAHLKIRRFEWDDERRITGFVFDAQIDAVHLEAIDLDISAGVRGRGRGRWR